MLNDHTPTLTSLVMAEMNESVLMPKMARQCNGMSEENGDTLQHSTPSGLSLSDYNSTYINNDRVVTNRQKKDEKLCCYDPPQIAFRRSSLYHNRVKQRLHPLPCHSKPARDKQWALSPWSCCISDISVDMKICFMQMICETNS